jgi:electron transport complex protein RnfD
MSADRTGGDRERLRGEPERPRETAGGGPADGAGAGGPATEGTDAETPRLHLAPSPHIHSPDSTPRIMWTVVATLVPIIGVSTWFFGLSALLVLASATLGALLVERTLGERGSLGDGSAVITGLLLGLTLPAGIPLWMAFLGGAFAIGFGKLIFGGLGQNIFNPALLGRAFLQAAFPTALTTWPALAERWTNVYGSNLALPLLSPGKVDVVTMATPLGLMKFEHQGTDLLKLAIGNTGGSLGETAGILILVCGAYLAWKNYLNWRIPVAIFSAVAAFSALLHALSPSLPGAPFMLLSGGLMLGAVYMATDMVTSPVTNLGSWIFGIGIGLITVVIRLWGGLAEGVMYSILFMNALVPFIDQVTRPAVFGTRAARKEAA